MGGATQDSGAHLHPHYRHPTDTGAGPGSWTAELFSIVSHPSLCPGSAVPTSCRGVKIPGTQFTAQILSTSSGHKESGLIKFKSRSQVQAHPTVPSMGKTQSHTKRQTASNPGGSCAGNFLSYSKPTPVPPFLQSQVFQASWSVAEQGGSLGLSPLLITNRG